MPIQQPDYLFPLVVTHSQPIQKELVTIMVFAKNQQKPIFGVWFNDTNRRKDFSIMQDNGHWIEIKTNEVTSDSISIGSAIENSEFNLKWETFIEG